MMIDNILTNSLVGGIAIALIAAPLGSIVLWRKMAYFGDSLSHAALLGVTLGIFLHLPPLLGGIIIAALFALVYNILRKNYSSDTLLGILAYGSLSLALIIASSFKNSRLDLNAYLFGDILLISHTDIIMLFSVAFTIIVWLKYRFRQLISIIISEDLASVEKINVQRIETELILIISLAVAITLKMVGILLITAMLIIPPAAARHFSKSPKQMISLSFIVSLTSVLGGLFLSYQIDTPASATIILISVICFIISNLANFKKLGS